MSHRSIRGDCLEIMPDLGKCAELVIADPPYGNHKLINDAISRAYIACGGGPMFFFMYAEDLQELLQRPDQILFWCKPPSTKNTSRRYSRFVEVIACFNLDRSPFNQDTYWHTRSGLFTDTLTHKPTHPFEKPVSLHEKLLAVNSNPGDLVLDPFAGSESVRRAAENMGRSSISIEIAEARIGFEPM